MCLQIWINCYFFCNSRRKHIVCRKNPLVKGGPSFIIFSDLIHDGGKDTRLVKTSSNVLFAFAVNSADLVESFSSCGMSNISRESRSIESSWILFIFDSRAIGVSDAWSIIEAWQVLSMLSTLFWMSGCFT